LHLDRLQDPGGAGRGPLLLVCGSPQARGVVTSASYEVREYGVRSGMPMARALRLCPAARRVPVPRGACARKHREIRAVLDRFVPVVEAASIDEFYLDLSGTERVYQGRPLAEVATLIRDAVLSETRIQISIGGGVNRWIAKLAVRRAKPAGVFVVAEGEEPEFMQTLPLAALPGVGPRFQERLRAYGFTQVAELLCVERSRLHDWFGESAGDWLFERVRGLDRTPVASHGAQKSISRDETFARDIAADDALATELLQLVVRAGRDLRADQLRARTVTVRIRDADFTTRQASRTLDQQIESDRAIYQAALPLLTRLRRRRPVPARLLGVSLSGLGAAGEPAQLALFEQTHRLESERDRRVARVMDAVRGRFGARALLPGRIVRGE
jgi:DNA polymerase-4